MKDARTFVKREFALIDNRMFLDVMVNGLPAYWYGMGESSAKYLIGLLDGSGKSWAQLLDGMKVNDPWGRPGYEPMRGVNGELDNVYDPRVAPLTVTY